MAMDTIYEYTDATDDNLTVDVLPGNQWGRPTQVMFSNYSNDKHDGISVILPLDELGKLVNRLTIELDVAAHRPTRDHPTL